MEQSILFLRIQGWYIYFANFFLQREINGTAQDALDQIEKKGYARRYATDGRQIVKAGIGFSIEQRAMTEYLIGS